MADDPTDTLPGRGKASTRIKNRTKMTGTSGPRNADTDHERVGIRLSFLIHDVSRLRRSVYDHFMKPLGITRAKWWVLAHLSRQDGMMQTQLASVLEVGKASLGITIEKLEKDGWITRHEDPTDRRAKRVYLTRPAHALITRMTRLEHQFNDQVLADLTTEEQLATVKALQKMKDAIGRMDVQADFDIN
jgi:MarR family transcriptional regulator, transcriptional regulator for hemolysin